MKYFFSWHICNLFGNKLFLFRPNFGLGFQHYKFFNGVGLLLDFCWGGSIQPFFSQNFDLWQQAFPFLAKFWSWISALKNFNGVGLLLNFSWGDSLQPLFSPNFGIVVEFFISAESFDSIWFMVKIFSPYIGSVLKRVQQKFSPLNFYWCLLILKGWAQSNLWFNFGWGGAIQALFS